MGIDKQTDMSGELQIGPTSLGMVRIYMTAEGIDLPMDFTPEEAEDIAQEILDAAARAKGSAKAGAKTGAKAGNRKKSKKR